MRVHVLGHASVLAECGGEGILVDPLFDDHFAGGVLRFHPARALDVAALVGRTTLLVVTHEHMDHFHPPTLQRFPRDLPVVVPAHAALADAVREMGFRRVVTLAPWEHHAAAGVTLVATPSAFEVDELGLLLLPEAGGACWHMSDSIVDPAVGERVRRTAGEVALVATRYQPLRTLAGYQRGLESASLDRGELVRCLEAACAAAPRCLFPYFSGFAYASPHAWADRHVSPYAPAEIARLLRRRLGEGTDVLTVEPGDLLEAEPACVRHTPAGSGLARTLPGPAPAPWEPVDASTLWGLPSPRQQAWLRGALRELLDRGVLPWVGWHLERGTGLFDAYVELQSVWQCVVHAGERTRLQHAVDFRGREPRVYADTRHPDANVFSHVGGRSLWQVLRGEAGAEVFWMAGGYRMYEKLLAVRDGTLQAPPQEGWDLWLRLPDPLTHYLRRVGTGAPWAGG